MSLDIRSEFAAAQQDYRTGKLDQAASRLGRLLSSHPGEAAFNHLSALVLKKQGHTAASRSAFERALQTRHSDPGLYADYANLLDDLNEGEKSVAAYDRAIALAPGLLDARIDRAIVIARQVDRVHGLDDLRGIATANPKAVRAWHALALMLREDEEFEAADAAIAHLLGINPKDKRALHAKARFTFDRGLPSVTLFDEARTADPASPAVARGYASALLQEGRYEDAVASLRERLAADPLWNDGHHMLAELRWQMGEGENFASSYRDALGDHPGTLELWASYAVATARALGHERALEIVADGRRAAGDSPIFDNVEANSLSELEAFERAGVLYDKLGEIPDPAFQLARVRFLIKARRFDEAEPRAMALVQRGFGADAWPFVSIVWRMLDDPRWAWLEGERDLHSVIDLDELNPELPALAERLRALHVFRVHPFQQSLRTGTQTDGNLFSRIEPEIRSLVGHVRRAVAGYIAQLPPAESDHPFLSRPRDRFRFTGSWSVRLTGSGFHVNHIHNQGWVSSALYIALPETLGGGADDQAGWLALGEPAAEFKLGLAPLAVVKPEPGRLVLFPSIMWHGTRPFPAGERLTVAFDVG